jgi:cell division topological specificity factor
MSLLDYFVRRRSNSGSLAKERLQIILAHEHVDRDGPDYLPEMRREILKVIAKYVQVDVDQVQVNLERSGDVEVLELSVALPESAPAARTAAR